MLVIEIGAQTEERQQRRRGGARVDQLVRCHDRRLDGRPANCNRAVRLGRMYRHACGPNSPEYLQSALSRIIVSMVSVERLTERKLGSAAKRAAARGALAGRKRSAARGSCPMGRNARPCCRRDTLRRQVPFDATADRSFNCGVLYRGGKRAYPERNRSRAGMAVRTLYSGQGQGLGAYRAPCRRRLAAAPGTKVSRSIRSAASSGAICL